MLLEHVHTMDELTDEEFGKFVRAYASYIETGVEPNFDDRSMRLMWKTVKAFDDMNCEKYESTSAARREAGKRGAMKRWAQEGKGIASDSKNSKCHFANSKNALSVSDSESDSVAVVDTATTAANSRTDSDLAEIVQHFQEVIGIFPRSALDKLQRWREAGKRGAMKRWAQEGKGIASDSKNSKCHFANSKNALSVSDSESDSVAVVDTATTAANSRTDSDLAEIVQHFQEVIGIFPRSALDKLQRWREVYPVEIIRAAIDEAAENNVRKWRYVDGVLKGWQADGVRTLGDVEARREARKKPEQPQERKFEVLT